METNASPRKIFNESFSKKEVTFCDKSSILFYSTEEAVDSLNDSVVHTISNDNFPLLPEFSNMLENSIDSVSKYAPDLGYLPKAIVVLEKLPEAIIHKHTCSDSVTECCQMPNLPLYTDKVSSLKSSLSHHKKITKPVMNQISPILKKNKYQIQNLRVLIPKLPVDVYLENSSRKASELNTISKNVKTKSRKASKNVNGRQLDLNLDSTQQSSLHNSFGKILSSGETETSKFLGKNCTEGKENIKIVDSDESTSIVSGVNGSKVSFDKYPCIHLEKLNLGPYLYDISSSSDCLQSKEDVPMELEVGSPMNASGLSMTEKTLPVIEEVSSNTVKTSPPLTDPEDDSTSSNAIFPEENYCTSSILKNLLVGDKISSDDDSVLFEHKNSPKDASFPQAESIVKDTNPNNSVPHKKAQNKFPIVVLERLNLPFSESDIYRDSTESSCTDSVSTITNNVSDLPIQIENVCSISTENFYKIHEHRKKSSKDITNTIQKHYQLSSNQSFIDHFNETELNISEPKSNHVSSFASSDSSSESIIAENSSFISDDSSSDSDLPLIMLSKQKLNISHSNNLSKDSSSDDLPLININSNESLTLPKKIKNSRAKSYKLKKKSSIHDSSSSSSAMRKKGSKSQMSCDISKKKTKKKSNKLVECLPSEKKKKSKKSIKKKQMKVYNMITKYLEMQMRSKKPKKKSKKRKHSKIVNSVPSSNESDSESTLSSDSIALIYDSVEQDHPYAQNKNSLQKKDNICVKRKQVCHSESCPTLQTVREHSYAKDSLQKRGKTSSKKACHCGSTSAKKDDTKAKKQKKSVDKYRLGFLSNKLSLRFYNRFFASERLLFTKCKLKRNKRKELKRLFSRLKAVGLMSL